MTEEITEEKNKEVPKLEEEKNSLAENKEAKAPVSRRKEGSFIPIIFISIISILIAFYWDKVAVIKDSVHAVLDPSAGALLNLHLEVGMIIIVLVITFITTIVQKYATDQKAMKELREEQKILQKEMEKYKDHPEKIAELSRQQLKFIPRTYKLMSRGILFTGIPFVLFFRWFNDYFTSIGSPKLFGFMNWLLFYFIVTLIFSGFLRKWMKVL